MSGGGNLPIGPGIWGFIAFFVLAIALWLLVRNMNSRLRRMAYRDRDRADQFAADADVDGSRAERATGGAPDANADGAAGDAAHDAGDQVAHDAPDLPGDDPRPNGEAPRP